jgi:hypothetical protein
MPFKENGFLGKEAGKMAIQIYERNKDFFELCYKINRFAEKIKFKFEVHNQDGQEIIAACLFMKMLEGFQASIILTNRGFAQDTRVVIRTMLEALFLLKTCCEDKEFVVQYINSDEKMRLKWMNIAHNSSFESMHPLKEYATEERRAELKDKIDSENIREIITEEIAKKAGLHELYSAYRLFSSSTHVSPRSLEDTYIAINENGEISALIHEPTDKDAEIYLITLSECLLIGLKSMCLLFELKEDTAIDGFYDRLKQLSVKSNEKDLSPSP